mmetsp:Transcript_13079/g.29678  ORF Transcript_13079/g.29678 Transcript_13079/m.29678 type:complete len:217 (+) Transcript_13079:3-653(+)
MKPPHEVEFCVPSEDCVAASKRMHRAPAFEFRKPQVMDDYYTRVLEKEKLRNPGKFYDCSYKHVKPRSVSSGKWETVIGRETAKAHRQEGSVWSVTTGSTEVHTEDGSLYEETHESDLVLRVKPRGNVDMSKHTGRAQTWLGVSDRSHRINTALRVFKKTMEVDPEDEPMTTRERKPSVPSHIVLPSPRTRRGVSQETSGSSGRGSRSRRIPRTAR